MATGVSNFHQNSLLFFSIEADISFKTTNEWYRFRCNTTTENNLYQIYCEPGHGMGMLKVPEEATKECFSEINIQNIDVKVKGFEID